MFVKALALLVLAIASANAQAISASLVPDNSDVGLSLQFVITNNGAEPLTFIKWNTPVRLLLSCPFFLSLGPSA